MDTTHTKPHEEIIVIDNSSAAEELKPDEPISETPVVSRNVSFRGGAGGLSFSYAPKHLRPLFKQVQNLTDDDLLFLAEMTQKKATKLYSVLQYTGESWYLPRIEDVAPGEARWGVSISKKYELVLTFSGHRMTINVAGYVFRFIILVMFWFMCWTMMPTGLSELNGYVFDPLLLIITSSIIGGIVCRFAQIPPLIGVLLMGILWNNVPSVGYLTGGIYKTVAKIAQQSGLAVVLIRAGLSISKKSLVPVAKYFPLVAFLPMLVEGVVHGLLAMSLFDFPSNWAFLQGFVCAPSSPAVVVPAVLYLGSRGYDLKLGSLMSASIGFDAGVGVWTINFIINLVSSPNSIGLAAGLGPVQIFGGIIVGVTLGGCGWLIYRLLRHEADPLVTGKYSVSHSDNMSVILFLYVLFAAHGLIFYGYGVKLAGGAAIAVVTMSATIANILLLSGDPEDDNQKPMLSAKFISLWDLWTMPALFSMVGSQVVVTDEVDPDFLPKAVACWALAMAAKSITAFVIFSQVPDVPWAERIFSSFCWVGKATVQAAQATAPLLAFQDLLDQDPTNADLQAYVQYAKTTKKVAVLFIILGAPFASIMYVRVMPMFLQVQQGNQVSNLIHPDSKDNHVIPPAPDNNHTIHGSNGQRQDVSNTEPISGSH
eukprot:PhF_6_TR37494/c0_g1_i4/m.55334